MEKHTRQKQEYEYDISYTMRQQYEYDIGYIMGQLRALQEELARMKIEIQEIKNKNGRDKSWKAYQGNCLSKE